SGLEECAEAKRRPLPGALAEELRAWHRRLGASPESLANLELLARGEAVCTVAGQQPAPLGGPLYSLHKTASAVGMAGVVRERAGIACVPLFWTHGEDSDFDEIRTATIADAGLHLRELGVPAAAHREGAPIGDIAASAVSPVVAEALGIWEGLPGA